MLESLCHKESSFVTLTYDNENLPGAFSSLEDRKIYADLPSLVPRDVTLFLKRIREYVAPLKLRYYGIGEYGDQSSRPHYHIALFGYGPCPDALYHKQDRKQCTSPQCQLIYKAWGMGRITVDPLEQGSAQYICGYVTKKMTNKNDEVTKKWLQGRNPEKPFMSRRPGIGALAIESLAQRIEEHGDLILEDGDVPLAIRHGSKKWPLGRYMRQKLRKAIGLEDQKEVSLHKYQKTLREEAMLLQDEAYKKGGSKEFQKRLKELKERDKQIISNIESKFKLFKKNGDL